MLCSREEKGELDDLWFVVLQPITAAANNLRHFPGPCAVQAQLEIYLKAHHHQPISRITTNTLTQHLDHLPIALPTNPRLITPHRQNGQA